MMSFPLSKPLALAVLAAAAVSAADLRAVDLGTLVERSPFAPPAASGGAQVAEAPGTLEFRGMVVDADGPAYSVFDASANRGQWVREGARGSIRVTGYDAEGGVLEVEQNGRPVKLEMKRATITTSAAVALTAAPVPQGGGRVVRRGGQASAAQGDRMLKIAEEVRTRRAARLAAVQAAAGKKPDAPATATATPGF